MSIRAWDLLLYAMAGAACALLADLCYGLLCPKRRGLCFLLDLLFGLTCCAVLFCVTVGVMQDNLRGYLLLAWIGAALLWEKTAGRLLRKLICAIKTLVHWALRGLIARLRRLRKGLERGCSAICGKLLGKINKKSKSRAKRPFLFPKNRVK